MLTQNVILFLQSHNTFSEEEEWLTIEATSAKFQLALKAGAKERKKFKKDAFKAELKFKAAGEREDKIKFRQIQAEKDEVEEMTGKFKIII